MEESDSAGVAAHKRGWGIGGTVGGHGRGRGGGAWPQFTGPPTSAVGVGRFDSACGHSG